MRESVFHTIWKEQLFKVFRLSLVNGSFVSIIDPGKHNHGDGPDFLQAKIRIDNLLITGSVELHIHEQEWFRHRHHTNASYDSVILHVVLHQQAEGKPAVRSDGTPIPTLFLAPYLEDTLMSFLAQYHDAIPCEPHIHVLNPEIMINQSERMLDEYFEFTVDRIISEYPVVDTVQKAWFYLISRQTFRVAGYHQNCEPMLDLHDHFWRVFEQTKSFPNADELLNWSGLNHHAEAIMQRSVWHLSGSRPANHPAKRILQARNLCEKMYQLGWRWFLTSSFDEIIASLRHGMDRDLCFGKDRWRVWERQCLIPCLYILGSLSYRQYLMKESRLRWRAHHVSDKSGIRAKFKAAGWPKEALSNAGYLHLYKRYCNEKRCSECYVFKSIISA